MGGALDPTQIHLILQIMAALQPGGGNKPLIQRIMLQAMVKRSVCVEKQANTLDLIWYLPPFAVCLQLWFLLMNIWSSPLPHSAVSVNASIYHLEAWSSAAEAHLS